MCSIFVNVILCKSWCKVTTFFQDSNLIDGTAAKKRCPADESGDIFLFNGLTAYSAARMYHALTGSKEPLHHSNRSP